MLRGIEIRRGNDNKTIGVRSDYILVVTSQPIVRQTWCARRNADPRGSDQLALSSSSLLPPHSSSGLSMAQALPSLLAKAVREKGTGPYPPGKHPLYQRASSRSNSAVKSTPSTHTSILFQNIRTGGDGPGSLPSLLILHFRSRTPGLGFQLSDTS